MIHAKKGEYINYHLCTNFVCDIDSNKRLKSTQRAPPSPKEHKRARTNPNKSQTNERARTSANEGQTRLARTDAQMSAIRGHMKAKQGWVGAQMS